MRWFGEGFLFVLIAGQGKCFVLKVGMPYSPHRHFASPSANHRTLARAVVAASKIA